MSRTDYEIAHEELIDEKRRERINKIKSTLTAFWDAEAKLKEAKEKRDGLERAVKKFMEE